MLIEVFGTVAVSVMAIAYGLESRSRSFVLVFAAACLASSLYAGLIRAWPFAVIEILWAGLALRRWVVSAPGVMLRQGRCFRDQQSYEPHSL